MSDYIDSVFQADIERMKQYSDVEWPEELETEASRMITMEDYITARNREKWMEEGQENMRILMLCLLSSGRYEEAERACKDEAFRQKLYKELNINMETEQPAKGSTRSE